VLRDYITPSRGCNEAVITAGFICAALASAAHAEGYLGASHDILHPEPNRLGDRVGRRIPSMIACLRLVSTPLLVWALVRGSGAGR